VRIHEAKQKLDLEITQATCPPTPEQSDVLERLSADVAFLEADLDASVGGSQECMDRPELADKASQELFRIFRGQYHGDSFNGVQCRRLMLKAAGIFKTRSTC
jgi:hypothetical protein